MQHGPTLNDAQLKKYEINFVSPSFGFLVEQLELLDKNEQPDVLNKLMKLITADIKTISNERIVLSNAEDMKEIDETLYSQVQCILKNTQCDVKSVYDTLYVMLHEYRLNKSPDSTSIACINALSPRYEDTLSGLGTITSRLKENKEDPEPSASQIDIAFIAIVRNLLSAKILELSEIISSPLPEKNDNEQIEEDKALAIKLAKEQMQQPKESKKRKQPPIPTFPSSLETMEEEDRKLAVKLAQEEYSARNSKPRHDNPSQDLSNDEAIAQFLQEKENSTFTPGYVATSYTTPTPSNTQEEDALIDQPQSRQKSKELKNKGCILS